MKLLEQLKQHEGENKKGERHMPYRCSEKRLTIGYGRNLDANGIREDEAELMLRNDIAEASDQLRHACPFTMLMDNVRRDVLINMVFNMGINGLLEFKRTLAAVEAGNYDVAGIEMLDSKWAGQVGYRADDLARQMLTGDYK